MITVLKKCPISEPLLGLRLYHSPHKNVIFLSFSRTTTMIAVLAKSYVSESLWNCDHNRSAHKNALFLVFIRTASYSQSSEKHNFQTILDCDNDHSPYKMS